jgi:peptidoglycan/LPS O-acetylase OafA/YrhL
MTSWNSPTWSLSVEWTWYFAFPIALIMFRRFGAARGMLVMAGVTIAYRVGLYLIMGPANQYPVNVGWAWRTFLPGRLFEFGVGMAVAAIAAKGMQPSRWTRATVVGVLILALVAARMAEPVDTFLPVRDMLYGTASAALLFMVVIPQGGVIKWISEHIVLVWLGEFSYTLYLFHLTFISAIAMYLKAYGFQGLPLFGMSLLLLPITLAACWGLYFFVERPFLVRRPAPTVSPAVVTVALT